MGGAKHLGYELNICYHRQDGTWSPAKYMGDKLHQGRRATSNSVSHDQKYLFFCSDFSIYWMDTKIIDELR